MSSNESVTRKTFLQLAEVWGHRDPKVNYRQDFQTYVDKRSDKTLDNVLLIEPNPHRARRLRKMWAAWTNVSVIEAELGEVSEGHVTHYWALNDEPECEFQGPLLLPSQQRFPGAKIMMRQVPVINIHHSLSEQFQGNNSITLSIDLRRIDDFGNPIDLAQVRDWLEHMKPSDRPEAIHITTAGLDPSEWEPAQQLFHYFNYRRAGRAWGEAGTGMVLSKSRALPDRMKRILGRSRVDAGAILVKARDSWLAKKRISAVVSKTAALFPGGVRRSDFLNDDLGLPWDSPPIVHVRHLTPSSDSEKSAPWEFDICETNPVEIAERCHDEHGIWPISFSYPTEGLPLRETPESLICPITPGLPYTFGSVEAYLETYQNAHLAVTHRKAGWDCFRHVEIFASGAIPLMPDAHLIPAFSMIHYPKNSLIEAVERLRRFGSPPTQGMREAFREYFLKNLTTQAMAEYMLHVSGLTGVERLLFLDERLPNHADYQSILTLIGLKQILGNQCHVLYPTDYIYQDSRYDVCSLYGRGFGYTSVVPGDRRSSSEKGTSVEINDFDAIVVGSISRNADLARRIIQECPAERTIWIHGEDSPPVPSLVKEMRQTGAHVFVRAIHTNY